MSLNCSHQWACCSPISATFSVTNPTWNDVGVNTGQHGERQLTAWAMVQPYSCLKHETKFNWTRIWSYDMGKLYISVKITFFSPVYSCFYQLQNRHFAIVSHDIRSNLKASLIQPFSIFLPWRNPWNNFQVSGNPCIKIIISTAHGTLSWLVSCRYNNPIIIVNALLSREWYFSVDLFILTNKLKKTLIFFNHDLSRNP
jgi:hypothetical protein